MLLISVIISTYNWKEALALCLESLFSQDDLHFEIIVADDGSRSDTTELISYYVEKSPVLIKYIYYEDKRFRAGEIRNNAVFNCLGDYIIFLDSDCIKKITYLTTLIRLSHYYFISIKSLIKNSQSNFLLCNIITNASF